MKLKKLAGITTAVVLLLITGWILFNFWPLATEPKNPGDLPSVEKSPFVKLSPDKLLATGIRTQTIERIDLALSRTLPARFAYDDTQHIAICAPTDGVVESVLVKPGDTVVAGETIAVVRSPAVGAARSEVLSKDAEYELAKSSSERHREIYQGVERLCHAIAERNSLESIEQQFSDAALGRYGADLITKYSKALLADRLAQSASSVQETGAISGRVHQQRQSESRQAQADLEGALDQSLFETKQAYKQAQAAEDTAERELLIARQQLATLLGAAQISNAGVMAIPEESSLVRLDIRSPIAGTVETKVYSSKERVTAGSEMFVVADTSRLWVKADVRNRDWDAIQVQQGDPITVTSPVSGDKQVGATVYFIGREVDPVSGAIPLVATIYNNEGKYRPGLYARVEVPLGSIPDTLVVPESSVIDLGGIPSVFVEEDAGYRPVRVEIGATSGNQVEVLSGLEEGQKVVAQGASILKSELLLESE